LQCKKKEEYGFNKEENNVSHRAKKRRDSDFPTGGTEKGKISKESRKQCTSRLIPLVRGNPDDRKNTTCKSKEGRLLTQKKKVISAKPASSTKLPISLAVKQQEGKERAGRNVSPAPEREGNGKKEGF